MENDYLKLNNNMNLQFKKSIRGYDIEEVDSYINKLVSINRNLESEISNLKNSISNYSQKDNLLKSTLIRAEELSLNLRTEAENQAKIVIDDAEKKAYKIIRDAQVEAKHYMDDITKKFYGHEKELKGVINNFYLMSRRTFHDLENQLVNELDTSLKRLNNEHVDVRSKDNNNNNTNTNYNNNKTIANPYIYDIDTDDDIVAQPDTSHLIVDTEYDFLIGKVINKDIKDDDGYVVVKKNTIISTHLIEYILTKGLYKSLLKSIDFE